MNVEDILPLLSPEALAFVTQLVETGDQATLDMIMQIVQSAPSPQEGVAALESAIQEFMASGMGAEGGLPPAGAEAAPSAVPPMNDMSMPTDPAAMMPPGFMPAGDIPPGMDMPPPPPAQGSVQPMPEKPEKKKKKIPKYKPPKVPNVKKPTYEQVLEDAKAGREYYEPRQQRIREDYDLYHLTYDEALFGDKEATIVGGIVVHRRTQPNSLVNLVTSLTTAKNDKLNVELEPRADDTEHQEAAQNSEDFILTMRELDEERWLENKPGEPPLPRKEAGLAALEGGFGWGWYIDPDDIEYPIQYEVIPLSQLFDLGHATTRQFTIPLHRARARWDKVAEAYPLDGKNRWWNPNQQLRIICHADNHGVWHSIAWEEVGGKSGGGTAKPFAGEGEPNLANNGERWIEPPYRTNFGFRAYNYVVWGGTPGEAMDSEDSNLVGLKGHGVLTMLRKTFRLMDLFISAVATGALANVDPAYLRKVPADVNKLKVPKLNRLPGTENVVNEDEEVEPLRWDVSASADSQNLMNSLIAELQDVASPALSGAMGPSGVAQQMSTDAAAQQVVVPIIDAMEKWYALQHKQRLILALRYSKDDKYNKDANDKPQTYFDTYEKRSYRGETWGEYGELRPEDIELSGVRVKVRYHDRNIQEEMALANMVTSLTQAHLMSQETALRRMGVKDPKRELERITADGAFMEPAVLKALIEEAVYNSGNQTLIAAWDKAFYADSFGTGQGSQPAPAGTASIPSPANQPGANLQGTSSAVQAPGAQQMGMMM